MKGCKRLLMVHYRMCKVQGYFEIISLYGQTKGAVIAVMVAGGHHLLIACSCEMKNVFCSRRRPFWVYQWSIGTWHCAVFESRPVHVTVGKRGGGRDDECSGSSLL